MNSNLVVVSIILAILIIVILCNNSVEHFNICNKCGDYSSEGIDAVLTITNDKRKRYVTLMNQTSRLYPVWDDNHIAYFTISNKEGIMHINFKSNNEIELQLFHPFEDDNGNIKQYTFSK